VAWAECCAALFVAGGCGWAAKTQGDATAGGGIVVLLAERRDDKALATAEGPLRIVVPAEKRQARWVRQVVSLTIRRA
jgi:hypothetical protein